jgi:hypothetical protein
MEPIEEPIDEPMKKPPEGGFSSLLQRTAENGG